MKYFFKTEFGTFFILPQNGGYELWIKELNGSRDKLGFYQNAQMASDDVYQCATGFYDWDLQGDVDEPSGLEEWTIF